MPPWRAKGQGQLAFLPLRKYRRDKWLAIGPSFYFDCCGDVQNVSHKSIGARSKAPLKSQPVKTPGVRYTRPLNP
jgi:hypothetical protein